HGAARRRPRGRPGEHRMALGRCGERRARRATGRGALGPPAAAGGVAGASLSLPLADRVGGVTGASTGIGPATAVALAEAGMSVVLGARRAEALGAVRDRIRAAGGRAEAITTDLRDPDQVAALVNAAVDRFGRLDALVNNAAIGYLRPIAEG